ncbi:MAG: PLP-dependent transferase [Opitutaceae bacterium]|nr:PLP-dependent transferase [Opitutaceae bacterium]
MNTFPPRPLGSRIPDRLHAVSCSLPTMRDIIGYEEKDAATIQHMSSGYPRFVIHPMLLTIERAWAAREGLKDAALWMVSSRRMAERLVAHVAPEHARIHEHDGVFGVSHRDDLALRKRARSFLQHTGGFLSSRAAEAYCVTHGLAAPGPAEEFFPGDAATEVRETMARLIGLEDPAAVLLAPSGMNAFFSAFCAVNALQRPRGRDLWLQVGWLYLDTGAILAKLTGGRQLCVFDVQDRDAIARVFVEHGARLAGVVTEITTNPLMQTPDLPWLAGLAREHGAYMLVDPSITSPFNVDVTPHADVVLNSLTKYAAAEGDVIAGAVAVTPRCPERAALHAAIAGELEPVDRRDVARLASQIGHYEVLMPRLNAGAHAVIDHLLRRRRGVRRVYWSGQVGSHEHYRRLARGPDRIGPVLSFEIDGAMPAFYDALPLAKGPSFGMRTTLICPFIYLAHYDLVTTESGRRALREAGVPIDLLRLSVGEEPPDQIIDALEQGFFAAGLG